MSILSIAIQNSILFLCHNQQKIFLPFIADRDDEADDFAEKEEEESWGGAESDAAEQSRTDETDSRLDESDRSATNRDIQDIIDALQQIDQQSTE